MEKDVSNHQDLRLSSHEECIRRLMSRSSASLPHAYLNFMAMNNGWTGYVGGDYLMLWSIEDVINFTDAYQAQIYAYGLIMFGSNGSGDCYGFDTRTSSALIVKLPFVGMSWDVARESVLDFSDIAAVSKNSNSGLPEQHAGMELFEIKPVIFGGDPTDTDNKTWLTREQHIQAVCYWNSAIANLALASGDFVNSNQPR